MPHANDVETFSVQLEVAKTHQVYKLVHLLPYVQDTNRSAALLPLLFYLGYILHKPDTIVTLIISTMFPGPAHVTLDDDLVKALCVHGGACGEFLSEEPRGFQVDICSYIK